MMLNLFLRNSQPVKNILVSKYSCINNNLPIKRHFFRGLQGGNNEKYSRIRSRTRLPVENPLTAAPGPNAYSLGKGAVAGASIIGLGALCYYGANMSKSANIYNESMFWPDYVKERIHKTYEYFLGSVVVTAGSAYAISKSPRMLQLVSKSGFTSIIATFALMIGSGILTQSISYSSGVPKHLAWVAHCSIIGAVIAPICLLGGPIITRAAWYTAGVVGGLSAVATCAPSEKFMYMGGPLAIGLGVVFVSSLGSMFLPPTTMLGAGLYSLSLYGGLILFSGFLLYDTQRIVHKAKNYPMYAMQPFDPVNACLSIYMDVLNIFLRIATILAGGGGRRK